MPDVRQTPAIDGSLTVLASIGYCTTKTEGKWVIRNSRSYQIVDGIDTYDDPVSAQEVCDYLNQVVKDQEIELLRRD